MHFSWFPPARLESVLSADANAADTFGAASAKGETASLNRRQSLAWRLPVASSLILAIGMAFLGSWVSNRIARVIQENTALSVALFMESIFEPLVQDLASDDELSPSAIQSIEEAFRRPPAGSDISSVRIWRLDGSLAYPKIDAAAAYPTPPELAAARQGGVRVGKAFTGADAGAAPQPALVSIFAPMHKLGTGKVIAIAEYIEPDDHLARPVAAGISEAWMHFTAIAAGTLALLFALLYGGSMVIARQHDALDERYSEQLRLNGQNTELRRELQQARLQSIEGNEKLLGRIGADLHDGPAQLLALAMLDLDIVADSVRERASASEDVVNALANVQSATREALKEIRHISAGLVMPEQQWKSCADAIRGAVEAHERRTGDKVHCQLGELPPSMPELSMASLYRAVQEGLNNAHRHAAASCVALRAHSHARSFSVEVSDDGPGFDVGEMLGNTSRLGLAGLRHRIESVGGNLQVISSPGCGTRLLITLPNSAGGTHAQ